jgi:hypothetical protein
VVVSLRTHCFDWDLLLFVDDMLDFVFEGEKVVDELTHAYCVLFGYLFG